MHSDNKVMIHDEKWQSEGERLTKSRTNKFHLTRSRFEEVTRQAEGDA